MQAGISIPFVETNVTKCICPQCPVQQASHCVSSKFLEFKDTLSKHPLNREDIPGVYCSAGTASCTDIQTGQDCICGKCVIFTGYKLFNYQPRGHYCRDGNAK